MPACPPCARRRPNSISLRPPAASTQRAASRRDQRLEVHDIDERRLDELRFEQGRGHLEHRLVGKEHRPLAHRADLTREAHPAEPLEEGRAEEPHLLQEAELVVAEPELLQEREPVLDPRGDQIAPARRQVAAEELEGRRTLVDPLGDIALAHRQLVEVDQERLHRARTLPAPKRPWPAETASGDCPGGGLPRRVWGLSPAMSRRDVSGGLSPGHGLGSRTGDVSWDVPPPRARLSAEGCRRRGRPRRRPRLPRSSVGTTPRRRTSRSTAAPASTAYCHVSDSARTSGTAVPRIAPAAAGPAPPRKAVARSLSRRRWNPPTPSRTKANDGANATSAASSPPVRPARPVADGGDGVDDRARCDLAERDRVQELARREPVIPVHRVRLHQRDDHEAPAVGERADLERHPGQSRQAAHRRGDRQRPDPEQPPGTACSSVSSTSPQPTSTSTSHGPIVAAETPPASR